MVLTRAEFAYNNSMNWSTGKTPFEIVTRMNTRGVSELRDVAREEKRSDVGEEFDEFDVARLEDAMIFKLVMR